MDTIHEFCEMSGVKVNLDKFHAMCFPNISRPKRDSFLRFTSVRFVTDLGNYLGCVSHHG